MHTEVKKRTGTEIEISFEVPWEEVLPYMDRAVLKLSKNITISGFRPGKAPMALVEKRLGQQKILSAAAESIMEKKYQDFLLKESINIIAAPKIEILKIAPQNPFCFRIKGEILSQFKLPDYKRIASGFHKKEISVSEHEVSETLNRLQFSLAEFQEKEEGAKEGDFVEVEYQSPQIEHNRKFEDRFILGKGQFVPGFEQNLKEARPGEEKKFSIPFPKDYEATLGAFSDEKLQGQEVSFSSKVKKVYKVKPPQLDDQFARNLGGFKNLEELKLSIKQSIGQEKEKAQSRQIVNAILDNIAEEAKVETPQCLVSLMKEQILEKLKEKVNQNPDLSFEQYLKDIKKTEEEIINSFEAPAQKKVRDYLIIREIAKQEHIEVFAQELQDAVSIFLKNLPDAGKIKQVDSERLKEYYKGVIFNEKVLKKLEGFVQ